MSKKSIGQCVFQFDIPVDTKSVKWLEGIVTRELVKYHASMCTGYTVTEDTCAPFKGRVVFDFSIGLADFGNRARDGALFSPLKHIRISFRKQRGFETYEKCLELEAQGRMTLENATVTGYEVNIRVDCKYRPYRAKLWRVYECKNHYTYNSECNKELEDDICIAIEDIMNHKGWYLPDVF